MRAAGTGRLPVKVVRFDPGAPLIVIKGQIWGPRHRRDVRLALDTGAREVLIVTDVFDALGYSPRDGEAVTRVRSAVAEESGYFLRVNRFRALGHEVCDFRIDAHDLPEGFGIDGLLGLSFLRLLNYEIRSAEGRIRCERIRHEN
jgi:predicted aspartyl protease